MRSQIPLYKSERTLCCVHGCNSRIHYKSYDGVTFHKLPFDPSKELLRKWVSAIKLPRRICSHMIVCSLHFEGRDYTVIDGIKELKPDAVPSKNLPSVWRNKFLPRNYGGLIKLIEVRGIGRLRLCYEAKLARAIRRAEQQRLEKKLFTPNEEPIKENDVPEEVNNKENSKEEVNEKEKTDKEPENEMETIMLTPEKEPSPLILNSQDSNNSTELITEDRSLTSEIVIKDEPLSETEETEETVEEMLAKMNEESEDDCHVTHVENDRTCSEHDIEQAGWRSVICNICGEEECEGHEEELFICTPCGKQFKTNRQLNAHNLSHFEYRRRGNLDAKEVICKVCNQVIPSKVTLNDHMLTHSNDQQHVCMLCDKPFRNKISLVMHINSHTIHPNHRCKLCGQCFEDSDELDRHVRKHRVLTREYTCKECGQRFRSKQACWAHLNSHLRAKSKPGLACDVCGRVLSTRATLKEHMFIHSGEKPFECQLCGKKIRHRANFIIHVQGHSLGQPYMCSICGMGFSKKTELASHTVAEHPEDRPFYCIICGMRFRTEFRFQRHAMSHDASLEEYIF